MNEYVARIVTYFIFVAVAVIVLRFLLGGVWKYSPFFYVSMLFISNLYLYLHKQKRKEI